MKTKRRFISDLVTRIFIKGNICVPRGDSSKKVGVWKILGGFYHKISSQYTRHVHDELVLDIASYIV